jgi:hypothetical protein
MIRLAGLVNTGKRKINEIGDVPKKALAYVKPIYAAAAKSAGFKVTKIYESGNWVNAEIEVWQVTKQQHSGWVLGVCFTKAKATKLGKALKETLIDYDDYQESPATTKISKDHYYLSPYEAAEIGGAKYDDNKLRDLMSQ